ncbi:hypothetical protein L195_g040482 [Trifolium pratense]|uniref:Uncharacterized protein n=1 Tax=Trifolium pratense TaxID=57577 RepID=A0A2K3M0W9_TRIPR|nr:hypothetical protein L195_g040482 [Trifolium pratense]
MFCSTYVHNGAPLHRTITELRCDVLWFGAPVRLIPTKIKDVYKNGKPVSDDFLSWWLKMNTFRRAVAVELNVTSIQVVVSDTTRPKWLRQQQS